MVQPSQAGATPTKLPLPRSPPTGLADKGQEGLGPPPTPLCSLAWEGAPDHAQWLPPASLGKSHLRPTWPRSQHRERTAVQPSSFSSLSHSLPQDFSASTQSTWKPSKPGGCFTPTRMVSSEHQKVTSADEDMEKAEGLGKVGRKVKWCKCDGK